MHFDLSRHDTHAGGRSRRRTAGGTSLSTTAGLVVCVALLYALLQHPLALNKAPPGAADAVLSMNRWGTVPVRIVDVARERPDSLTRSDYVAAARATFRDCARYSASLQTTYAELRSEACDLAAREVGLNL